MTIAEFGRNRWTRRRLLGTALAAGVALPVGVAGRAGAAPATPGPATVTLPAPTGPHPIGTASLHLIDASRPDPATGRHRELMASIWYPTTHDARHHPRAPWMPPASMRALLASAGFDPDAAAAPLTAGRQDAPVLRRLGRLPVIVYSHGAGGHRSETTITVQELASHGYIVVTVDHTGDAYTEFPDGRLSLPDDDVPFTPWDSTHDIRFILDRVDDLAAGRNPDAGRRPLPAGLSAALDPHRIAMYGWSKGATSTALTMNTDPRVRAGLSLDGPMQSRPPVTGLHRPFMLMTAEFSRAEPSVEQFWSGLHGWRLTVRAEGALHAAYCDHQWLLPQLAAGTGMSDEDLRKWIGTLDPARAVRIQQAYPLAFFDRHLRGRRGHLLDGPSAAFPEVTFVP